MLSRKQTHANSSMWKVDCKKDNMKEMCCDLPRSRKRYGRFTQRPTCSGFYKSGAFSWNAGHTTSASSELRGKEENGEPLVSSRWNPTPEQVKALQEMYERGVRTPSADEIQLITAKLSQFGKIEGKNVFYWFQNHKARERQKIQRQTHSSSSSFDLPLKHAKDLEANSKAKEESHLQLQKKKFSDTLPDLSFMASDMNPVSESFISEALCLGEKKETTSISLNISLMTKNEDLFQVLPKRRNNQMLQLFPSLENDLIRSEGNGDDDDQEFTPKQFYVFL